MRTTIELGKSIASDMKRYAYDADSRLDQGYALQ